MFDVNSYDIEHCSLNHGGKQKKSKKPCWLFEQPSTKQMTVLKNSDKKVLVSFFS